jgi:hypothetical protein
MLTQGVAASIVKTPSAIRYCPLCLTQQFDEYGEFYWRREWQVPGVKSCTIHGALVHTSIQRPLLHRHRFIAASPDNCPMMPQNSVATNDFQVALNVSRILKLPLQKSPSFHQWSEYYQNLAHNFGYVRGKRQIDHPAIHDKIIQYWSSYWLYQNNLSINRSNANASTWVESIFRKHRKAFSYMQHIIVNIALFEDDWNIDTFLNNVKQSSEEAEDNRPSQTFSNLITNTNAQQEWLALLTRFPPKAARKNAPALYARLYRSNHDWLVRVNSDYSTSENPARKSRVDWKQRDVELHRELRKAYRFIEKNHLGPRRSKRFLMKSVTASSTLEKNLYRLPLSNTFIEMYAEDVGDYQIRRLKNAFEILKQDYMHPPVWRVLKKSGLSDERLTEVAETYLGRLIETQSKNQKYS